MIVAPWWHLTSDQASTKYTVMFSSTGDPTDQFIATNAMYNHDYWTTTSTAQQWIFGLIEEKQKANDTNDQPTAPHPPPGMHLPTTTNEPMPTPQMTNDDADHADEELDAALQTILRAYARYLLIIQPSAGTHDPRELFTADPRNNHPNTEGAEQAWLGLWDLMVQASDGMIKLMIESGYGIPNMVNQTHDRLHGEKLKAPINKPRSFPTATAQDPHHDQHNFAAFLMAGNNVNANNVISMFTKGVAGSTTKNIHMMALYLAATSGSPFHWLYKIAIQAATKPGQTVFSDKAIDPNVFKLMLHILTLLTLGGIHDMQTQDNRG